MLILREVGETIASKDGMKLLILNGQSDRETHNMTAKDYVIAITNALNRYGELDHSSRKYITHIIYAKGTDIPLDLEIIENILGIVVVSVAGYKINGKLYYREDDLVQCICHLAEVYKNNKKM